MTLGPGEYPSSMRRRSLRIAAWLAALATQSIAILYIANIPFYAGSTIGSRLSWRMEHGRFRLECKPPPRNPESFYIANNSEGLRFAPDWHIYSAGDWFFKVPLWVPLGASVLATVVLFAMTRRRCRPGACGNCGYDLTGLAAGTKCPECGEEESSKRKAQSSKGDE